MLVPWFEMNGVLTHECLFGRPAGTVTRSQISTVHKHVLSRAAQRSDPFTNDHIGGTWRPKPATNVGRIATCSDIYRRIEDWQGAPDPARRRHRL
jgi:hypothetical protein